MPRPRVDYEAAAAERRLRSWREHLIAWAGYPSGYSRIWAETEARVPIERRRSSSTPLRQPVTRRDYYEFYRSLERDTPRAEAEEVELARGARLRVNERESEWEDNDPLQPRRRSQFFVTSVPPVLEFALNHQKVWIQQDHNGGSSVRLLVMTRRNTYRKMIVQLCPWDDGRLVFRRHLIDPHMTHGIKLMNREGDHVIYERKDEWKEGEVKKV